MTSEEFARRVEEVLPAMYRVCRLQLYTAADREDAVQEAIFRAWQKLHTLRSESAFSGWLMRILVNVCHDIQKQRRRVVPTDTVPEPEPRNRTREQELMYALSALDEKQRLAVALHYLNGYSVRETARIMKISENAVKLRLMRGRKQLRQLLDEEVF